VTLACYLVLAWGSVMTPWLTQVGEEKFNRMVRAPLEYSFDLAVLLIALVSQTAATIRGLLNRDVTKAKEGQ